MPRPDERYEIDYAKKPTEERIKEVESNQKDSEKAHKESDKKSK